MTKEESDELDRIFDVPFLFGLVAQGHIPTIEQMIAENKTWEEIGNKIGWCPKTAKEHYDRYLARKSHDAG